MLYMIDTDEDYKDYEQAGEWLSLQDGAQSKWKGRENARG
jgi:hypothetical protein